MDCNYSCTNRLRVFCENISGFSEMENTFSVVVKYCVFLGVSFYWIFIISSRQVAWIKTAGLIIIVVDRRCFPSCASNLEEKNIIF